MTDILIHGPDDIRSGASEVITAIENKVRSCVSALGKAQSFSLPVIIGPGEINPAGAYTCVFPLTEGGNILINVSRRDPADTATDDNPYCVQCTIRQGNLYSTSVFDGKKLTHTHLDSKLVTTDSPERPNRAEGWQVHDFVRGEPLAKAMVHGEVDEQVRQILEENFGENYLEFLSGLLAIGQANFSPKKA